ncbi:MAG: indolepyruvate oxidoreductase subunit beta [Cellulosilyticaceae bacterium]
MSLNILLAGVGGQGIILASKLIAQSAIEQGYFVRTSETIGMAQRGGCVVSHVRIEGEDVSPVNHQGDVDVMLAFEPAEALRSCGYMKQGSSIVVSTTPIVPSTVSPANPYEHEKILSTLQNLEAKTIAVDGKKLCQAAGSTKLLNVILLGVALAEGLLPITNEQMSHVFENYLPKKWQGANQKALEVGLNYKQYC